MGLYDRQYYRDDEPQGLTLGRPSSVVNTLVLINAGIFVVNMFTPDNLLMNWLAVRPESLIQPWMWWQLLTYGFAHSPVEIWHILFNMFVLWMFGRDVEAVYGPREFLRIYLIVIVLGSLLWTLRFQLAGVPEAPSMLMGASGAVTAVVLLFTILFPKRTILLMFVLPVPAWVLGVLIVAYNIVGLGAQDYVAYDVHLVGAAFAGAYYYFGWNLGRILPGRLPSARGWFQRRPKLKVHHPPTRRDRELEQEADRVLAKLHREGEDSLTTDERRVLEDYSRRVRQRRQ